MTVDLSGRYLVYSMIGEDFSGTLEILLLDMDTGDTYLLYAEDEEELSEAVYPIVYQWE